MKYHTVVFRDRVDDSIIVRHYNHPHTKAELVAYTRNCLREYFDDLVIIGFGQDRNGSDASLEEE